MALGLVKVGGAGLMLHTMRFTIDFKVMPETRTIIGTNGLSITKIHKYFVQRYDNPCIHH